MAPILITVASAVRIFARNTLTASSEIKMQWFNPGNVIDILLLVGSGVVRAALAQYSGSKWPTPVVFSFGWVMYIFSALVSVIGDKRLMPAPDVPSVVINASTGYVRNNQSWILGRLLRDFEDGHWIDGAIKTQLRNMINPPSSQQPGEDSKAQTPRHKAGLCISVYEAHPDLEATEVARGYMFCLGYVVAVVQLVMAGLPWMIWGDNFSIFFITLGGTFLAFAMGSLPQWRRERYDCRPKTNNSFILTRGNGSQHALVILGHKRGLNLEDLATSGDGRRASFLTRMLVFCFTILWVVLLITVDGVRENTWFLVAIGGLGSLYTVLVAALPVNPEQLGIPLKWTGHCFTNEKVMIALMEAEEFQSGLGRAMLETFFPGARSDTEDAFWAAAKKLEDITHPPFKNKKVDTRATQGKQAIEEKIDSLNSQSQTTP